MYNQHAKKTWDCELDIYGKVRTFEGSSLSDCPFRYYDPNAGSYISQDPIGLTGNSFTFYGYVKDINTWTDIWGLRGHVSFIGDALHPDTVTPDNPGGLIKIQATGSHTGDKIAVYDKTKNADVWSDEYRVHHVEYNPDTNEMTMQIVKKDDHALGHTGGAKDFKDETTFKYNTPEAIDEASRRSGLQGNH